MATKEERLLRVMGLADARQGDPLAGLSPVPQVRFSFELTDSARPGVSFDKTPIRLKLSFRRGDEKAIEGQIDGEVGQWDACRERALDWLGRQLAAGGGNPAATPQDDLQRAKQLAEEELSAVAPWTGLAHHEQAALDLAWRRRIAPRVLRAAHLDPTNEPAAYLAACYVDALYPREGKDGREVPLAAIDRAMIETQRYLDRFPRRNVEHHLAMLDQAGSLGFRGAWKAGGGPDRPDDILRPPDVRRYPYVRCCIRARAENGYLGMMDERYYNSNAFSAFGYNLVTRLVPCIPDDKLDEEYEYWRTFYATKVDKVLRTHDFADSLNKRPAPWNLVDAAFQARKKNPQEVRRALQRLAEERPRSERVVWGGGPLPARIPMFLKAAGDPDWNTWKPDWPQREVVVTAEDRSAMYRRFAPPAPDVMDLSRIPPLEGLTQLVLDADVLKHGEQSYRCEYPKIQPIALVHGQVWLVAPGLWDTINCKRDHALFVVGLDQVKLDGPSVAVKAARVDWPPLKSHAERIIITAYLAAPDGDTFWFGTRSHGLARFTWQQGRWVGRWIAQRQGLPAGAVEQMAAADSGKALEVRVLGPERSVVENGKRIGLPPLRWRCRVDLAQATVRLLGEPQPRGVERRPPLRLTTFQDGKTRHWEMPVGTFFSGDRWRIRQIDPGTGKPQGLVLEGRLSRFARSSVDFTTYASASVPLDELRVAVGLGECIWTIQRWEPRPDRGEGDVLMIYRPTPEADKDWPRHDRWIGPFRDRRCLFAMLPDAEGRLWLTSGSGVYVTDWRRFLARHRDVGFSTQQWREADRKRREQAGWRVQVRQLLAEGHPEQAMAIVDGQRAALGSVGAASAPAAQAQWTVVQLHRAMLLARNAATRPAAIDLYRQLATCPWVEPAARERSWARHIELLSESQRWAEVVQAAEEAAKPFPRILLQSPGTNSCRRTVEHAKKMLRKSPAAGPGRAEPAPFTRRGRPVH